MSVNNLTPDSEWRYIIQWFIEYSELQKDDFLPILVEYLTKNDTAIYMNGIVSGVQTVSCEDKPLSLFQCRIKLFKQWSSKWPADFKTKLSAKLTELDPIFGERIKTELASVPAVSVPVPVVDEVVVEPIQIPNNELELVQLVETAQG